MVAPPQVTIKTEQSITVIDEEKKIESVDLLKQFIGQKKLHLQAKDKAYLVVDVSQQCLWLLKQQQVLNQYLVSTAKAGTGNLQDSLWKRINFYWSFNIRNIFSAGECISSIYIHGTTNEKMIGQPTSQGCIRMRNDDIINLFDQVEVGGLVYVANRLN